MSIPKRESGVQVTMIGDNPESLLVTGYEEAYEALPEPYQADSCLVFWVEDSMLFCRPKDDQIAALGSWVCVFNDRDDGPGYPAYGWIEWDVSAYGTER